MSRILFRAFGGAPLAPVPLPLAGSGKIIEFDPPGAIGLPLRDAVVLFRFDETDLVSGPADAARTVGDLLPFSGGVIPVVGDGVCGRTRVFVPSPAAAFIGDDLADKSSLLTRDMTIQVILSMDAAAQSASGHAGMVVARGTGSAAAQYRCYGLEIVVDSATSFLFTMRWVWQDTAGVDKTQTGAQFSMPPPLGTDFTMLTATRRWVSPTEVVLRYYIGDLFLGEVVSADGSIGGGTLGRFLVGAAPSSGNNREFAGAIDELLILDHEISHEEVEATWLRITRWQPLGYQLIRELHDKGHPNSPDPGTDVQLDLRMTGNALGYAAARAEDVRANILPQRAYGSVLEDWEEVVRVTPEPQQDIDTRRARVLAKIRQRLGSSLPGFGDALAGLLGGGAITDLEFLAFSNQIDTDFATIDPLRWDETPTTAFSVVSGAASCQPGAGTFLMNGVTRTWVTLRQTVGGDAKQAHALTKLVFTTPQSVAEAGIYFENAGAGNYLLLGLRDDAGSFKIQTEIFLGGVSQGLVLQATLGANPAAVWLHLYQTVVDGTWKAEWSVTSGTTGFTSSANITFPTAAHWTGCYLRSTGAIAAPRADFDDHKLYEPFSGRPFNAYILLDRSLGFSPDIDGANDVISAIKHGFVHGAFITNPVLLADDPDGGADVAPTGGY
jgi:hypothetical protein